MKKTKTRMAARQATKAVSPAKLSRKSADLAGIRLQIANLVGNQAIEMVNNAIIEANKGHYSAMKYLFELVGLSAGAVEPEPQGEDVLAKTLLHRLGMLEKSRMEIADSKDSQEAGEGGVANPVE